MASRPTPDYESDRAPWMHIARLFLGESEIPGAMHNEKIVEMFRLIGHPELDRDEIPWCAAAVGACLSLSGFRNTRSALARSYENFGEDLGHTPREGCVVVFWRGSRKSGKGHVGFYAGEKDGQILVIGGNQSNGFSIAPYAKSHLLSYRWPVATSPLPNSFLPTILDIHHREAPGHLQEADSMAARGMPAVTTFSQHFLLCHEIVAKWEGGYVDHPSDPGGATNFGITRQTLQRWRGGAVSKEDVQSLSYSEALEIFYSRYWEIVRGDHLPLAAALLTYNAAVNMGPSRAARFLQKALNVQRTRRGERLEVDGEVGPLTLDAARRADLADLIDDFAGMQRDYYEGLRQFSVFGQGWLNRLADVRNKATDWARDAHRVNKSGTDGRSVLPEDELTTIDQALGGRALKGKKTLIATGLYIALVIAQGLGLLEGTILESVLPSLADANEPADKEGTARASTLLASIKTVLLSLAGLGALSKVERGLKTLRRFAPTSAFRPHDD